MGVSLDKTMQRLTRAKTLVYGLLSLTFIPGIALYSPLHSTNSYAKPPKVPLVVVDKAQVKAVIKQTPLTGTVTSSRVSRLSSEVGGIVKAIKVTIGDIVTKNDLLIQLDSEIETLTLKARQALTYQAQEELAEAKRRYENGKQLRKQNSISKEEMDQRQTAVKIAEAVLENKQAEEHKQKAIVKRFSITAPFSGVISEKKTEVGEWVDSGKQVLTLIAIDDLYIDFQVPQELYTQINNQSKITITLDALPGKTMGATINALVPVSDPGARTFLVRTKLDESVINMTPGMSAQGMLQVSTGQAGVVVSRDAIIRYRDGRVAVWIVNTSNKTTKVTERLIKVGHSFNGKVLIVDGLQAGESIVVQGNESLKEGQTVQIYGSQ